MPPHQPSVLAIVAQGASRTDARVGIGFGVRNLKAAGWCCHRSAGDAAEAYAREVIYSDLEEPGEDDMFRKVTADFERHGKTVTREQLAAKLGACLDEAQEQIR